MPRRLRRRKGSAFGPLRALAPPSPPRPPEGVFDEKTPSGKVIKMRMKQCVKVSKRLVSLVGVRGLTRPSTVLVRRRADAFLMPIGTVNLRPRPAKPNGASLRPCSGQADSFCSYRRSPLAQS